MKRFLLCLVALGLLAGTLPASTIVGTFNIGGTITVTNNTITWRLSSTPFTVNETVIAPGATGIYTGLDGTDIVIADLNRVTEPVGVAFAQQPFLSAIPAEDSLDINFIFAGIYSSAACTAAPAVGQVCTPATPGGSPFNFVNNPPPSSPQTTGTFVFSGVGRTDPSLVWIGNFTSSFRVPYQTVLQTLAATGSVTQTFSGAITVSQVPEPGTLALLGLGLMAIGSAQRRRKLNQ